MLRVQLAEGVQLSYKREEKREVPKNCQQRKDS
jgi:hypothetical protein